MTPGPWSTELEHSRFKDAEWWVYTDQTEHKLVAICDGPHAKSNAMLIAAAPDLLVAVEAMVKEYEECGYDACGMLRHMDAANAAIRKARGLV